jgi:hypothetical protein
MGKLNIACCDFCGKTGEPDEFWATIKFRSKKYEYDAGTNPQEHEWFLCRGCKVAFLELMEEVIKKTRQVAAKENRKTRAAARAEAKNLLLPQSKKHAEAR